MFYFGIGIAVVAILVLIGFGGMDGLLLTNNPFYKRKDLATIPLSRVLAATGVIFSLVLAVPMAVTGRGLLHWKPWAKTLGMFVAALGMLHFPIGTGIGVYALWTLSDEATEFLFENAPVRGGKR
jgi:hypothetical protein